MTEFIENIFSSIFGNNVVLATILIAFVPIIELKGAIPFSMSTEIWGSSALSLWEAFGCGLLGSCLVVPLLALIYDPLIRWLKKTKLFVNLASRFEEKVNKKKQNIEDKTKEEKSERSKFLKRFFGVFIFVAIPLPFTGVWTGTCIAVALGLGFWRSCLAVISGNVVAGIIITLITMFFGDATLIFFYILIGIILAFLLFVLVKYLVTRKRKNSVTTTLNNVEDNCIQNKEENT